MKSVFQTARSRPSVDSVMTPMIDVVFLLLIFFLTSSSFQRGELQLPGASATPPESELSGNTRSDSPPPPASDFQDIVVKIRKGGSGVTYEIQKENVSDLNQLIERINAILRVVQDVPIVIDPENDVDAGEAIRVYDLVRARGSLSVFLVAR